MSDDTPKPLPGWRIKLSNQGKEGLVVNAATEERARALAVLWANNADVTIVSCKRMADDEFFVSEGEMWTPPGQEP